LLLRQLFFFFFSLPFFFFFSIIYASPSRPVPNPPFHVVPEASPDSLCATVSVFPFPSSPQVGRSTIVAICIICFTSWQEFFPFPTLRPLDLFSVPLGGCVLPLGFFPSVDGRYLPTLPCHPLHQGTTIKVVLSVFAKTRAGWITPAPCAPGGFLIHFFFLVYP